MRYDYVVMPGADASQIERRVERVDWVQAEGDKLVLGTRFGAVKLRELYAYQVVGGERRLVPVRCSVEGEGVQLVVAGYDRTQPLIIDPLVWSTFLGGEVIVINLSE